MATVMIVLVTEVVIVNMAVLKDSSADYGDSGDGWRDDDGDGKINRK